MIYFVDFEASSLMKGSFPIEIAWVDGNGKGESHLIRPTDEWMALNDGRPEWSAESERVHGIPLATLLAEGKDAAWVARRTEEVLGGLQSMAFCDSPPSDGYWMGMLLKAGGVRRSVPLADVYSLYGWACRPLRDMMPFGDGPGLEVAEARIRSAAAGIIGRAEEAEARRPRTRHRALPDAESLQRTWRAVQGGVADWLAVERGQ